VSRVLYFDCFSGISGDIALGDCSVDAKNVLTRQVSSECHLRVTVSDLTKL
jgi:uncharacterized protein (DUF111 family)